MPYIPHYVVDIRIHRTTQRNFWSNFNSHIVSKKKKCKPFLYQSNNQQSNSHNLIASKELLRKQRKRKKKKNSILTEDLVDLSKPEQQPRKRRTVIARKINGNAGSRPRDQESLSSFQRSVGVGSIRQVGSPYCAIVTKKISS